MVKFEVAGRADKDKIFFIETEMIAFGFEDVVVKKLKRCAADFTFLIGILSAIPVLQCSVSFVYGGFGFTAFF